MQGCVVHLVRASLARVSYRDRKSVASALKEIYGAATVGQAEAALEAFESGEWNEKYPAVAKSWRANWERVIPFLAFSENVRKGGVHDQPDREPEQLAAQGGPSAGPFPRGRTRRGSCCTWRFSRHRGPVEGAPGLLAGGEARGSRSSSANASGSWTDGNRGWNGGAPARIRSRLLRPPLRSGLRSRLRIRAEPNGSERGWKQDPGCRKTAILIPSEPAGHSRTKGGP